MWKDYEEVDWDNWSYDENDDGKGYSKDDEIVIKDANGNILQNWDSVIAIKDLPVKGGQNIKRWDKFKNIKLTDDPGLIESGNMVLKTEFFKKI